MREGHSEGRTALGLAIAIAIAIAVAPTAGCDAQNRSNGLHGQLTFYASSPLPTGAAHVEILDGTVNVSNCHFTSGSYGIPGASCSENELAVTEVLAASCSGIGCVVESSGVSGTAGYVALRTSEVGSARLSVRVRLADGREKSDELDLTTVPVTQMRVSCERATEAPADACPGAYGVFVGARWVYAVDATSGETALPAWTEPEVVLEGTSVTREPGDEGGWVRLAASSPGTTHVILRVGEQSWSADVRVASPSEVVDVALLHPTETFDDDPLLRRFDPPRAFPSRLARGDFLSRAYPVWSLADGAQIPGGVCTLVSSDPSVVRISFLSDPSPYWWFAHFETHPGTAVVTATMGEVSRAFPITVE
ncbi:MAG: hypothetical protein U0234_06160 [Sandaracinus sp.]